MAGTYGGGADLKRLKRRFYISAGCKISLYYNVVKKILIVAKLWLPIGVLDDIIHTV